MKNKSHWIKIIDNKNPVLKFVFITQYEEKWLYFTMNACKCQLMIKINTVCLRLELNLIIITFSPLTPICQKARYYSNCALPRETKITESGLAGNRWLKTSLSSYIGRPFKITQFELAYRSALLKCSKKSNWTSCSLFICLFISSLFD